MRHDYNSTSGPFLLIQSRRQKFHNATSLNNEVRNGTGVHISSQTVRNRLHEFRLNARRPALPLLLKRNHEQDWKTLPEFTSDFTDRHQLVLRMLKERFDDLNVAEHDRYGKGSVMVWAGISVNGKTDLYAFENGTLTALRYCN